jgi:catechol 2,3-dioxygenase-like lactoylglutathione lyase family enzyme
VIASGDLEASRALFGGALGLRLALERRFEERRLHMLFYRLGGVTVEVVGRLGAPPDASAPDRFGGLAWRVADVDAARERLAAADFDVSEVRPGVAPGTRVCTVRDGTCGVPTLLIEVPPRVSGRRAEG